MLDGSMLWRLSGFRHGDVSMLLVPLLAADRQQTSGAGTLIELTSEEREPSLELPVTAPQLGDEAVSVERETDEVEYSSE